MVLLVGEFVGDPLAASQLREVSRAARSEYTKVNYLSLVSTRAQEIEEVANVDRWGDGEHRLRHTRHT